MARANRVAAAVAGAVEVPAPVELVFGERTDATGKAVPVMFTADNVRGWYADYQSNGGTATPTDQRRISILRRMVVGVDTESFRKECEKLTDGLPKGSQERKNWANVRSDLRALYGACRYVPDAVPDGMGYGKTISAARGALTAARLTWKGDTLKTAVDKLAEKRADAETDAARAGRIAYHKSLNTEGPNFGNVEAAEAAEADAIRVFTDARARSEAQKIADGIWKKHGHKDAGEFVEAIIEALHDKLQLVGEATITTADKQ